MIDAAPDFDLIEIEGDAAFLSRPARGMSDDAAVASTLAVATAMHRAFHIERQYVAKNLCPCKGCAAADNLKLKFVAHIGDVATQTIRQQRKLVGIDVILVHRLLKNGVQIPEYVLLSEELHGLRGGALPVPGQEVLQDLDGIGPTRAYFVDVADLSDAMPPLAAPSVLARLGRTFSVRGRRDAVHVGAATSPRGRLSRLAGQTA